MTSGPLLLYHLGLIVLPLAALALTRFRLTPALLLVAVLHHHPMEPLPHEHEAPPICCALAQSIEAEPATDVVGTANTVRLIPPAPPARTVEPVRSVPAIRGPPEIA